MATTKKTTTKKTAAKSPAKPAVKKTAPKKVAPKNAAVKKPAAKKTTTKKSSILSYSRPKEFEAVTQAAAVPTGAVIASPELPPAPVLTEPAPLHAEELATGTTGMVSAPAENVATDAGISSPLAAESKAESHPEIEGPADVISGEPLPSSVPAPGEPARASSISLPPSILKIQRRRLMKRVLSVFAVLVLVIAGGFWYFVVRTPDVVTADQQLIKEVSRLVVVPTGETPSVTTVVDENKVNQEFLRSAQKGDKVLLYFQAGRAVVFRPSTHQIVNMGPLQTPRPRVFLRKGSSADNLSAVATTINQTADFLVTSRDDSPKKSYTNTIVVDVAGNRPDIAQRLAKLLGATVAPLPDGESRPDADLLVLVGSDYGKQ